MASPVNQHCATCIGTLSFAINVLLSSLLLSSVSEHFVFSVACDNRYQFNTVNTFIVATKQVLHSKLQIACHQKNF